MLSSSTRVAQLCTRAVRYAVHVDSILAVAMLSFITAVLEWIGSLPAEISSTAFVFARWIPWAYLYLTLRKSADGGIRLPILSDYHDTWETLIVPTTQLLWITLWGFGPLALVATFKIGFDDFMLQDQCSPLQFLRHPSVWRQAAAGFAIFYLPPTLVTASVLKTATPLINPFIGLMTIQPVIDRFVGMYAFSGLVAILLVVVNAGLSIAEQHYPIPLAASVIRHVVVIWLALVLMRALGTFAHAYRSQMATAHRAMTDSAK